MSTVVPFPAPALVHPTPCPSWCQHRSHPAGHHFGPSMTAHYSSQQVVTNADPLPGTIPIIIRAELTRLDEGGETGETVMYVQGETDMELDRDGVDMFIADLEAMLAKVRVLRRQMG